MLVGLHHTPVHEHFIHYEVRLRAELTCKLMLVQRQALH